MSKSGKERSNFRGGGGGGDGSGDGDDGDEDDEGGVRRGGGDDAKKRRGKNLEKAKHWVSFPFRKAKKQLVYSGRQKSKSNSSASCSGKMEGFVGCYLCFKRPQTLESSANSQTSDPNNPAFTYEHLKLLIEKNDFYSKECNPHIPIPSIAD